MELTSLSTNTNFDFIDIKIITVLNRKLLLLQIPRKDDQNQSDEDAGVNDEQSCQEIRLDNRPAASEETRDNAI